MGHDCWVFEYLYRDAGNFKTHGFLLVSGLAPDAESTIRRCLEWGDQFVAEQVGIPALCHKHWEAVGEGASELDHAFHEFAGLRPTEADDAELPHWGSLPELVARFEAAAGHWDVTLSPNCEL